MQVEQPRGEERVVLEEGRDPRLAREPAPLQTPVLHHAPEDELRGARRRGDEPGLPEHPAAEGERRDCEPVPPGEHLLVPERRGPARPRLVEHRARAARAPPTSSSSGRGTHRMLPSLEVPLRRDAVERDEPVGVGAEQRAQLRARPRRRTAPPRPPSRRRSPSRARPRARSSRAGGSRASAARRARGRAAASPATPPRRRPRGARCRRASSRSAGRATPRRSSSGGTRRRADRGSRPPPSSRA